MRTTTHDVLPTRVRQSLAKFGADLNIARKKRRLTIKMMTERIGVAKSTYARLEKGDPAVSLGIYAMALYSLGLSELFGEIADQGNDDLGLLLDVSRLPKRVRPSKPASFGMKQRE